MARPAIRFAPSSDFAGAIGRRVSDEFRASGKSRFADWTVWTLAGGYFAIAALAYGAILGGGFGATATLGLAVLGGVSAFMTMAIIGHDASHGSLSSGKWLNELVLFVAFAVLGISGALWGSRHVRVHHQLPNLPGTGIDADGSALLRLSPHKPWRPGYALQPLYAPFVYMLGVLNMTWIEDFHYLAEARRSGTAEFRGWRSLLEFAGAKVLHLALFFVIPALALHPPVWGLLATYAVAMTMSSATFLVIAIGAHISELSEFPMPDRNGRLPHDWATHQVVTAVDWMPTNPFVAAIVGGANADVAHHLFPQYSHCHVAFLSRIVAEEAAAHGVPYRKVSFAQMFRAHWRHVSSLSRPQAPEPAPRAA
ncbi:MAG TPA: fatty acid desaturase [Stellaceae bacterium]|nr:fatty acid desaturase [Stellaceae bacterium]